MGVEIERKFLVDQTLWQPKGQGVLCRQGYLSAVKERVVRVRVVGHEAFLTVKGISRGITRLEYEYPIPRADAEQMLEQLCEKPLIEKTRHAEDWHGRTWEIDVFHGENAGLVMAEVEIEHADAAVALPAWATAEVSSDPRYFNSSLIANPYTRWAR